MNSKIIAIIAVVIIAAAGVGGAVVLMGGDSGSSSSTASHDFTSYHGAASYAGKTVTVFGNADGDQDFDADDVTIVTKLAELQDTLDEKDSALKTAKKGTDQAAIDSAQTAYDDAKKALSDYEKEKNVKYYDTAKQYKGTTKSLSLADANCDGKYNALDVALVSQIVDIQNKINTQYPDGITETVTLDKLKTDCGVEPITVFYYDVDSVMTQIKYPLTGDMAIGYKSNYEAVMICKAQARCTYACDQVSNPSSSYYSWYHEDFKNAQGIGSRFTPDYEVFLKSGNTAPQFFLTGTRAWFDDNMETTLAPQNVTVLRLPFWEDNVCLSSVATLGFLIGCQVNSNEYVDIASGVLEKIEAFVKDIDYKDRPFVFQSYNASSISTMHNGIHEMVYAAGGCTPWDYGYSNGSIDAEAVMNMNADWIGLDQYFGFLETYDTNAEKTFEKIVTQLKDTNLKYIQAINHTQAYKDGKVVFFNQGTYMGPASYVTIAYLFNKIYADHAGFVAFDVDALFSEYLAKYHPSLTIDQFVYDGVNMQYYDLADYKKVAA